MSLAKTKTKIHSGYKIWKSHGWFGVLNRIRHLYAETREKKNYQKWIKHQKITEAERRKIREEIKNLKCKSRISIVMPVYDVGERWLRLCIESVLFQLYENWELCIADDCSPSPHIKKVLEEYAAQDERIKIVYRAENGHISAASNSALELATGEFTALLDHDDELAEDALFRVAKEISDFPEADMIYSDEDLVSEQGHRYNPKFKPDWSRDLIYSLNLITHLSVYRTSVLRQIGGWRVGLEGSQDYDLALRVVEQTSDKHIRHIPRILYHWRAIKGSVALASEEKPYAHERAREAIRAHLERTGKKAIVSQSIGNFHRVSYDLPENLPKTSLIISADGDFEAARRTIEIFTENTDYRNFDIVLIGSAKLKNALENQSFSAETKIIVCENQSEAARLNFAAAQTSSEILCFVDANLKPLSADWLKELISFACQTEIGAVGAKLLSADEKILHGGLIIGTSETVSVAHYGLPGDANGNLLRARLINNFSAVSVSCMAVRREVFVRNEGFDAANFPEKLFDSDFCLRLGAKNYRIVFTPYAELIQTDGKKTLNVQRNLSESESKIFRKKWQNLIGKDSFYNPNFTYENGNFSIK